MDPRIGKLTRFTPVTGAPRAAAPTGTGLRRQRTEAQADTRVTGSPPLDVLRAVDAAAARADELHRADRELHFEIHPTTGRVAIQVRDLEGNVIRDVRASEALDIIDGKGP
jgi:flagellar protein FlaG